MGNFAAYTGPRPLMVVHSAGGQEEHLFGLVLEVRFIDPTSMESWSAWFDEKAVIRRVKPNVMRLSGREMRRHFFFGMPAEDGYVAVGKSKNALMTAL